VNTKAIEQHGFKLVEQLNETSHTIAWKAVQKTLDRTVILRILKPEAAADPLTLDHFLKIARRIARIKSDGLSSVFDIVSDDDFHYVVMEHVDGPTIEELIERQGPLSVEQILKITLSITRAINQMWSSEHIVHRNLKSATIRLDARGIAKITDFSLAILTDEGAEAYSMDDGHIVGTPCFLSPEQAQGSTELATLSDMYALGAVCYHMATGKAPFEGQKVVAILNAHLHDQLPPPHVLNPRLPMTFSWFVRRLMMKSPELRYRTWEDIVKDLIRQIEGQMPLCVCPHDTSLSTVVNFSETAEDITDADAPRIRLKLKRKNSRLAAYQSKTITDEHAEDIRRTTRSKEILLWSGLTLWLLLVFWYRAAYETAPPVSDQPEDAVEAQTIIDPPATQPAEDIRVFTDTSDVIAPTEADNAAPVADLSNTQAVPEASAAALPALSDSLPLMPPALAAALAKALSRGDLQNARAILQAETTAFQDKDDIQAFLDQMPDLDSLVAEYLKTQIGKPLVLEHNGVLRTVIPRGIDNNIIHLEAGGRGVEMPISRLAPDTKLRWMGKPAEPPALAAYCLALMRSARRDEVYGLAEKCPPLTSLLTEAARLPPDNQ